MADAHCLCRMGSVFPLHGWAGKVSYHRAALRVGVQAETGERRLRLACGEVVWTVRVRHDRGAVGDCGYFSYDSESVHMVSSPTALLDELLLGEHAYRVG